MTLEEKIGQMVQVDLAALKEPGDVSKYFLGSMLSGGGSDPADNLPVTWLKTVRDLQTEALKTRLHIPMIYGIDAVHGHNNIDGAVVFPHNIG
ncbi:MAG TPA: glycoside hydrolase family 3 N-terminal domain-containing protein, partial [Verrucomicrobiae bacterium]